MTVEKRNNSECHRTLNYLHSMKVNVLVTQSCPVLWNPLDCSPSGSSVHGILQAALLEWVAVSFSSRSSSPRDQTHVSCISCIVVDSLPSEPLGKSMRPWGLIISSLIWFLFQTNTLVFPIYFSPHFVLFHDILELFLFSSYISFLKCVKLQG